VTNETAEGLGWWLASDGSWYPPELHPDTTGAPSSRDQHPAGSALRGDSGAAPVPSIPTRRSIAVEQPRYSPQDAVTPPAQAAAAAAQEQARQARAARLESGAPQRAAGAVPSIAPVPTLAPAQAPARTMAEDRSPAGPQLPDLFEQALLGSSLADTVRLGTPGGDEAASAWDPMSTNRTPDESDVALNPVPAGVGTFQGARVRRRWRIHH